MINVHSMCIEFDLPDAHSDAHYSVNKLLQMAAYPNNSSRRDCCSPRQCSRIVGHHVSYVAQFGIGRNKEFGAFN